MGKPSRYWIWTHLISSGKYRSQERPEAKDFFRQQFPQLAEQPTVADEPVQSHLHPLMQTGDPITSQLAELCLRCFISNQIVQVCDTLVSQFGNYYGFRQEDLLPLVLDNVDSRQSSNSTYQSLAGKILKTFKPESGSLTTWIIRLVRQHRELNEFLLEHGLYLLSNWAILNDTKPERLRRVFTEFYPLPALELERAIALLESYRIVYLGDRLKQRTKGQCPAPTEDQLQRISVLVREKTNQNLSTVNVLAQLQKLAKHLRQHRIHIRRGSPSAESIETPETLAQVECLSEEPISTDRSSNDFLAAYRQEFQHSLSVALEKVVNDRLQKSKKPDQGDRWLKALYLFHCRRMTMTAIAPLVELRSQDNVSRLLKLKDLRADVRRHMLQQLQRYVLEKVKDYHTPEAIQALDTKIETALSEQIEALLEQEAKQTKTPKGYLSPSIFSQRLCQYLDTLSAIHQSDCYHD
jgi:hypothetical protein